MTDLNLDYRRRVCEAAIKGQPTWWTFRELCEISDDDISGVEAEFIATFDPPTVLRLLKMAGEPTKWLPCGHAIDNYVRDHCEKCRPSVIEERKLREAEQRAEAAYDALGGRLVVADASGQRDMLNVVEALREYVRAEDHLPEEWFDTDDYTLSGSVAQLLEWLGDAQAEREQQRERAEALEEDKAKWVAECRTLERKVREWQSAAHAANARAEAEKEKREAAEADVEACSRRNETDADEIAKLRQELDALGDDRAEVWEAKEAAEARASDLRAAAEQARKERDWHEEQKRVECEAKLAAEAPKRQVQKMLAQIIEDGTLRETADWTEDIPRKLRELQAEKEKREALQDEVDELREQHASMRSTMDSAIDESAKATERAEAEKRKREAAEARVRELQRLGGIKKRWEAKWKVCTAEYDQMEQERDEARTQLSAANKERESLIAERSEYRAGKRKKMERADENYRLLSEARAEVERLKALVPAHKCVSCKSEADPACFPDTDDMEDVWCEPCLEVKRLDEALAAKDAEIERCKKHADVVETEIGTARLQLGSLLHSFSVEPLGDLNGEITQIDNGIVGLREQRDALKAENAKLKGLAEANIDASLTMTTRRLERENGRLREALKPFNGKLIAEIQRTALDAFQAKRIEEALNGAK